MSETQAYKIGQEFTVPGHAAGFVRRMFEDRLTLVRAVLADPLVNRAFTRRDLDKLTFEALELAKMINCMPEAVDA